MKTYSILQNVIVTYEYHIQAENEDEAMLKARNGECDEPVNDGDNYNDCEYIFNGEAE